MGTEVISASIVTLHCGTFAPLQLTSVSGHIPRAKQQQHNQQSPRIQLQEIQTPIELGKIHARRNVAVLVERQQME